MTEEAAEDERDIELSAITAIFPELAIDPHDPHRAKLVLDIAPVDGLILAFKPAATPAPPPQISLNITLNQHQHLDPSPPVLPGVQHPLDSHHFTYLPPLTLDISLPSDYPNDSPPRISLSSDHSWVSPPTLKSLEDEVSRIWEDYGRSAVVYAYIDFLQQHVDQGFSEHGQSSLLAHELKAPMLEFDCLEKKRRFELGTFDCGVCLEPKKGSACYRLRSCGHVFCIGCLQDFYNSAITEGDITNIKCLAPDCGAHTTGAPARVKNQRSLHPTELLDIPLDRAQVQRYVDIKRKKKFESDKSTVYCPRTFCQAPARSVKYAKYETAGIEDFPESDSESDSEVDQPAQTAQPMNLNSAVQKLPEDRLAICSNPKCAYAFCRICQRSWHGDFLNCLPPSAVQAQLSSEDKASYEYIRLNTSPCPTCEAPCQKTHGCNHMRCFTCNTHFCYLCSSWLSPSNPYQHFNTLGSPCYMRLWELEEGDEGQGQGFFAGPRGAEQAAIFAAQFDDNNDNDQNNNEVAVPAQREQNRPRQRENANGGNARRQQPRDRPQEDREGDVEQALQRFLRLAANDEEDGWDSDELEFVEGWFV